MTMPISPTSLRRRRAFDRISITLTFGLSSIQIGASASRPVALTIASQSPV